jgi:hypothetical protein
MLLWLAVVQSLERKAAIVMWRLRYRKNHLIIYYSMSVT